MGILNKEIHWNSKKIFVLPISQGLMPFEVWYKDQRICYVSVEALTMTFILGLTLQAYSLRLSVCMCLCVHVCVCVHMCVLLSFPTK